MLRQWDQPIVGIAIVQKGQRRLASQFMVNQAKLDLGEGVGQG